MKEKKKFFDNPVVEFITTLIVGVLMMFGGSIVGGIICSPMLLSSNVRCQFAAMYAAFIGIWIVGLLLFLIKKDRKMFKIFTRQLKGNNLCTSLSVGLICGLGLNLIVAFMAMLHGDIKIYFNEINVLWIVLFIVVIFVQSGAEELLCRGWLYQRLMKICPRFPVVAIVGNALIFGALHLGNSDVTLLAIFNIVFVAILYSLIVYYFDSFWAPVIAHTSWNFCQNILLGLPNSGNVSEYSIFKLDAASATNSFTYDVGFGIEGTVFCNVVLVIACIVVFIIGKKRNQKPCNIWEDSQS